MSFCEAIYPAADIKKNPKKMPKKNGAGDRCRQK
jgi:hypothetical protein